MFNTSSRREIESGSDFVSDRNNFGNHDHEEKAGETPPHSSDIVQHNETLFNTDPAMFEHSVEITHEQLQAIAFLTFVGQLAYAIYEAIRKLLNKLKKLRKSSDETEVSLSSDEFLSPDITTEIVCETFCSNSISTFSNMNAIILVFFILNRVRLVYHTVFGMTTWITFLECQFKRSKKGKRGKDGFVRVFFFIATSEMFHDALHYSYGVTFTNIYPDDIRMFLALPVRVGGFFDLIDRKHRAVLSG